VVVVVVKLYVTVNYMKIMSVAKQCFSGKSMSFATMQIIRNSFLIKLHSN